MIRIQLYKGPIGSCTNNPLLSRHTNRCNLNSNSQLWWLCLKPYDNLIQVSLPIWTRVMSVWGAIRSRRRKMRKSYKSDQITSQLLVLPPWQAAARGFNFSRRTMASRDNLVEKKRKIHFHPVVQNTCRYVTRRINVDHVGINWNVAKGRRKLLCAIIRWLHRQLWR